MSTTSAFPSVVSDVESHLDWVVSNPHSSDAQLDFQILDNTGNSVWPPPVEELA